MSLLVEIAPEGMANRYGGLLDSHIYVLTGAWSHWLSSAKPVAVFSNWALLVRFGPLSKATSKVDLLTSGGTYRLNARLRLRPVACFPKG